MNVIIIRKIEQKTDVTCFLFMIHLIRITMLLFLIQQYCLLNHGSRIFCPDCTSYLA